MDKQVWKKIKKKLFLVAIIPAVLLIYFLGYWQGTQVTPNINGANVTPTRAASTTLINGTIENITADNQISIKDIAGKSYDILLNDTNIIDNKSKPFAIKDLKIGRKVIVYTKQTDGKYLAVRMIVS